MYAIIWKREINNFTICSGIIAIVCFNEMNNKISIAITTSHTIVSPNNYIHKSIMNHSNNSVEYIRHYSSKKMCQLQGELAMKYKIPLQNQLLFNKKYPNSSYKLFKIQKQKLSNLNKQTFLRIDSLKVATLNENCAARLFDSIQSWDYEKTIQKLITNKSINIIMLCSNLNNDIRSVYVSFNRSL